MPTAPACPSALPFPFVPRGRSLCHGVVGAVLGAVAARVSYALLTRERVGVRGATATPGRLPPRPSTDTSGAVPSDPDGADHPQVWQRGNFRGHTVTLQEGPALACGICVASMLGPGLTPRVRAATALAAAGAAAFGAYDDLSGDALDRGLRGHLAALARGRLTTGTVKMAGITATGTAAAALLGRGPADTLADGALIAAGANLVNLLDLRPGRALKAALIGAGPALASSAAPLVGPALGASAALLPDELAERSMLGDAGANALGAALGVAVAARGRRRTRLALLAGALALTLASERLSFSRVIDRVPALRGIDRWGRCA